MVCESEKHDNPRNPWRFTICAALTSLILLCIAVVLLMMTPLLHYEPSAQDAPAVGRASAASSDSPRQEEPSYFPAQFVNRATEVEPYVEPF